MKATCFLTSILLACSSLFAKAENGQEGSLHDTIPALDNAMFYPAAVRHPEVLKEQPQQGTKPAADIRNNGYFNHLDVAASVGTAGVGIDVAAPIGSHLQLRAGYSYMPKIKFKMAFTFLLEEGYENDSYSTLLKATKEKLNKVMSMLEAMTGTTVDNEVDVHLVPMVNNLRLLVDWFPFRQKTWHFTAGICYGPETVGKAYNYAQETTTLQALNIYNHMYNNAMNYDPMIGVAGYFSQDIYMYFSNELRQKFENYGHASFYLGPQKDGTLYHVLPDEQGHVSANCYVNRWRPYLGGGYSGHPGKTGRCTLSFECGALIWGGTPHVITHEGVDLSHDMVYIKKNDMRHLVDFVSALKVYPVIELRAAWRLF